MVKVQLTPLLLIYGLSAVVMAGLTAYGLRRLDAEGWDPTVAAFLGIVLGGTIWGTSRFFELLFVGEALTRFWIAVLYIGYGGATLSGLLFGLAFSGRSDLLKRRTVALIFAAPVLAVVLAATNQFHHLLWTGTFETRSGWYGEGVVVFVREFQPLFYAYFLYTVGGTLLGIYLLLRMSVGSASVYRRQTVAFSLGAISALTGGAMFALELELFVPRFVDPTPVGFTLMGLFFGYGIFRHQLLDLVPVARDTVVESMRDGYVVLDGDGRVVDLNSAALEVVDGEDAVGERIETVLPPCVSLVDDHEHGTRSEAEIEVDIDGEQRFLFASVTSLQREEQLIGRLLLLRDITERRSVQKRYQALIENASDLILVVDPDGEITYASPSIANVVGVDPESVIGADAFNLIHEDDRETIRSKFEEVLERPGERVRAEYRTLGTDGDWLYMEASIRNLLADPFVEGIVVNARNITERKEREQKLQATNEELMAANDRLEQFASVVSHDLRNPINVARGHLDLAREQGREESFETIDDSLQRMEAVIDDVLTLAKQGESVGETESVSLADRANEAWSHVATKEATLDVVADPTVEADPDRLLQLFENLFRNAIEHGDDSVTVRVGVDDGVLYVADDGPGIPPEQREQVFESGHTTNDDGTGLGLSIVSQIADGHSWEVTATESADGGARFEFAGVEPTEVLN